MAAGIISSTRKTPFSGVTTVADDPMATAKALHAGEQKQAAISPLPGQTGISASTPPAGAAMTGSGSGPDVSGYDADTRELDNDTQTVEGRINGIISKNSPLLQMAQTRAKQEANSRGLSNSSMAVQAGETATYGAALPIAQSDAVIANDVANRNMDARNTSRQFNSTALNTGSLAKFGADANLGQIAAQGEQQRQTAAQGADLTQKLQAQKAQLDIQVQQAAQSGDEASRARLLAQQGELDKQMEAVRGQQAQALQAQKAQLDKDLQLAIQSGDEAARSRLMAQQAKVDAELLDTKLKNDIAMQGLKGTQELSLQGLKGEQALDVANIEAQFKGLMQANDSAARIWTQSAAEIGAILRNPDTTPETKQQQVDKQVALMRTGLEIAGAIANVDLAGLLD